MEEQQIKNEIKSVVIGSISGVAGYTCLTLTLTGLMVIFGCPTWLVCTLGTIGILCMGIGMYKIVKSAKNFSQLAYQF